jgi:hypothetical protein
VLKRNHSIALCGDLDVEISLWSSRCGDLAVEISLWKRLWTCKSDFRKDEYYQLRATGIWADDQGIRVQFPAGQQIYLFSKAPRPAVVNDELPVQ